MKLEAKERKQKIYGTERVIRKFAYFPTTVCADDGSYRIWLEHYYIKQR
jgi:hypothetical protein